VLPRMRVATRARCIHSGREGRCKLSRSASRCTGEKLVREVISWRISDGLGALREDLEQVDAHAIEQPLRDPAGLRY
jgi:hypothetical protein